MHEEEVPEQFATGAAGWGRLDAGLAVASAALPELHNIEETGP
jgi:hypothetical protein